ncbi:hypothetical protein Cme02nite_73910 [Catellatospora methionotrophica]|uniref:Uncharacterized protein n=1 Tax=Catellatospora methionotrophica TaxID=121620 RepID=A0A8J3LP05_9ACTN|nr:hypothetical protein [Catellatospora methionotrophica]GIG19059.1 hypothetical protein Cme02nite_73910 [Catellatospora methionotrophica]
MSEKTIAAKLPTKPNTSYWTATDEQPALRFRANKPGGVPFTSGATA